MADVGQPIRDVRFPLSGRTALAVVRPLSVFRFMLWPAIVSLNGLGNLLLRLCGLRPGTAEETLHSPEELKLLVAAAQEAGLLQRAQLELFERVLNLGDRPISDIMTPRVDVDWIDINDDREEILRSIRESRHGQLLFGKGSIDEPLGMILKRDLLDRVLDGHPLDPMAVIRQPLVVHEAMKIFKVLEQFKQAPVRLATIFDEYGVLQGIVTQTNLLDTIAGELPEAEGEEPGIVEREDGSFLIDGMMSPQDAFDQLDVKPRHRTGATLPHAPAGMLHRVVGRQHERLLVFDNVRELSVHDASPHPMAE